MRQALFPSNVVRSEELRFALVMNGGVSLAVWMGGVSFEINRLVRETHPVYRGLLELTQTSARVDVISGTSAGGVNGAALALAQTYDRSLYSLREVWMERGAFARILRDPAHANPPSLLDGDGYYLPALEDAFAALAGDRKSRTPVAWVPIDLTLTATLLRGDVQRTIDDFGAAIEDSKHRTSFRFVRSARAGEHRQDAFKTAAQIELLARAARTTSSFPVAFEPVLWAPEHFDGVKGITAPVTHPRYLVDGGIVDNRPFDGALNAIFRMPNRGNVRRVLAYIAPDPSISATMEDDEEAKPPMMAEVAGRSAFAIPSSQSISDQLARIREHNRTVHRRRDALVGLARFHKPDELAGLAKTLFPVYRYRRIHGLIDTFAEWLESDVAEAAVQAADTQAAESRIGRRTLAWLRVALDDRSDDYAWTHDRIPRDAGALELALTANAPQWEWGLYAIEFLVEFMFDMLRRVQRQRYLMRGQYAEVVVGKWEASSTQSWERIDDLRTCQLGQRRRQSQRGSDRMLAEYWRRAFRIARDLEIAVGKRRSDRDRWKNDVAPALNDAVRRDAGGLAELVRKKAAETLAHSGDSNDRAAWNAMVFDIGRLLKDLAAPIHQIELGILSRAGHLSITEHNDWEELDYLERALQLDKGGPGDIVRAMLRFEVIHYAMSHRERGPNVQVELVQISGNSKSPLAGQRLATEKLAGMQLAHFGAFYKRAWRANDWMMGRLDAVERLLQVLLNPERLYRLYAGNRRGSISPSTYIADVVRDIALAGASNEVAADVVGEIDMASLRRELAFLDSQGSRVPDTLPECSNVLTRRLHLEIVHAEMPLVARCARDDETVGADAQGIASQLANQVLARGDARGALPPLRLDDAVALFRDKRIGAEKLGDEVGSDLFTKTVAQTVAVTHAAAAGERGGLSMTLRGLLKTLGLPITLFYWLAGRVTGGSRTSAALGAAALAIALTTAIIALLLPSSARSSVSGVLEFSWMLLGVCLLILFVRGPLAFGVMALALAAPFALYYAERPTAAVAVGAAEVVIAWLGMRIGGVRDLGVVLLILAIALVLFGGDATRDTFEGAFCLARQTRIGSWITGLDRVGLLPKCRYAPPIEPTLPMLLAFLLFFATFAGFVRGSPRRAIARWWRTLR